MLDVTSSFLYSWRKVGLIHRHVTLIRPTYDTLSTKMIKINALGIRCHVVL